MRLIILLFFMFYFKIGHAQQEKIVVKFHVLDTLTQKPISGSVISDGNRHVYLYQNTTDDKGECNIVTTAGSHQWKIEGPNDGFQPVYKKDTLRNYVIYLASMKIFWAKYEIHTAKSISDIPADHQKISKKTFLSR